MKKYLIIGCFILFGLTFAFIIYLSYKLFYRTSVECRFNPTLDGKEFSLMVNNNYRYSIKIGETNSKLTMLSSNGTVLNSIILKNIYFFIKYPGLCYDGNALVICGDNICYFIDPEGLKVIKKLRLWDVRQSLFSCGYSESLMPLGVTSDKCLVKVKNGLYYIDANKKLIKMKTDAPAGSIFENR